MKLAASPSRSATPRKKWKDIAHFTTKANGGKGAARELHLELISKSKGVWTKLNDKARA